ncbi:MAG TPA: alkaline shock response membrane anchor protein AmaP [Firmicutes bacterium]|nr:alkaline shock response membrane anchor protein AmaP [Bacillota bacterium]
MSLVDRVFLAFYSLCLAVVSGLLVAVAAGWEWPWRSLQQGLADPQWRLALGAVGAVFFAFSVRFLTLGFQSRHGGRAVVHETPLGDVRVSLAAVENLVRRVARQTVGVRDVKAWVHYAPAGLVADVRLVVSPDVNIPKTSQDVQKSICDYVRDVVGVGVAEIKVLVENLSTEPRRRVE